MQKKISSLGWWNVLKTGMKYAAYILIIVESVQYFIRKVEEKDGLAQSSENEKPAV